MIKSREGFRAQSLVSSETQGQLHGAKQSTSDKNGRNKSFGLLEFSLGYFVLALSHNCSLISFQGFRKVMQCWFMKVVPFFNKRYMIGVPFSIK